MPFSTKGIGLLGEQAYSRTGTENLQDESVAFYTVVKQGTANTHIHIDSYTKGT